MNVFLKKYFEHLNLSGLKYAVMRNYENLPEYNNGNDIDIMVSPKDLKAHLSIIDNVAELENWIIIQKIKRPYIWVIKLVCLGEKDEGEFSVLHFDLFPGGMWYGFNFMKYQIALEKRLPHGDFPIYKLSPFDEIFHTTVHHILYTGRIMKEKYLVQLSNILVSDDRSMITELSALFGIESSKNLVERVLSDSRIDATFQIKLRQTLAFNCLRKAPFASVRNWLLSVLCELRQMVSPPGVIVSVKGDESKIHNYLIEIKPWLEKINRLNHVFPSSDLRAIELPSFPTSRDRIQKYYGVGNDNFISSKRSINGICLLMKRAKRRGYIIAVNSNKLARAQLNADITLNLDRSSNINENLENDCVPNLKYTISIFMSKKF